MNAHRRAIIRRPAATRFFPDRGCPLRNRRPVEGCRPRLRTGRAMPAPTTSWAWYFLGMCNLQMQQPHQAKTNFTACLSCRKDISWPYLMRGFATGQLNQFDEAEKDFEQALALQPDVQAHYGIKVLQSGLYLRQARLIEGFSAVPWLHALAPNLEFTCRGVADVLRERKLAATDTLLDEAQQANGRAVFPHTTCILCAPVRQQQQRPEQAAKLLDQAIARAREAEAARPRPSGLGQRVACTVSSGSPRRRAEGSGSGIGLFSHRGGSCRTRSHIAHTQGA